MGQTEGKEVDVAAMWKAEEKLSIEQRRARYKCKGKYVTEESLKASTWDQNDKALERGIELQVEAARNAEKERRKAAQLKLKMEKKEQKKKAKEPEKKEEEDEEDEEDKEMKEKRERMRQERAKQEEEELKRQKEEENKPLGHYEHNLEINKKIALIQADITTLEIDAIVNAANKSLLGGGGIDGAIHSAAGKDLYAECSTLGGAETGQTKITRGYNLPAKYVLHTVGPVGRDPQKLKSCYSTVLQLVKKHKIKTVAICGISTGIYGYPLYAASHVALKTVREWLEDKDNRKKVDVIIMCTYLDKEMVCYQKLMNYYFPPPGKNTADVESIYNKAFNEYDPAADADRLLQDEQAEKALKKKRKEEARQREEQWKSMQQQLKAKQDNDNNKHNSDDTKDKVDDKKDADDDKKDKKDDADDNNTDDKDNKEDKDSKDTEEKKTDGSAAENTTAETAASSESNSNTQTDAKEDDSKEQ